MKSKTFLLALTVMNLSFPVWAKNKVMICESQCVIVDKEFKEVHQMGHLLQTGRNRIDAFEALKKQCKDFAKRRFSQFDALLAKSVRFNESSSSESETHRVYDDENSETDYQDDVSSTAHSRDRQARRRVTPLTRGSSLSSGHSFSRFNKRERLTSRYSRSYTATIDRFYQSSELYMDVEYASSRDKMVCDFEEVEEGWTPPLIIDSDIEPMG